MITTLQHFQPRPTVLWLQITAAKVDLTALKRETQVLS